MPPAKKSPRLKACVSCQTLNAPRQFYCTNCNKGFYSEEKLANRILKNDETNIVFTSITEAESECFLQTCFFDHQMVEVDRQELDETTLLSITDLEGEKTELKLASFTSTEGFLSVGKKKCNALAWNRDLLAVLSDHKTISLWNKGLNFVTKVSFSETHLTNILWIANLWGTNCMGILLVVSLEKIFFLHVNENFEITLVFNFDDRPYFSSAAARFNGELIEFIIGRYESSETEFKALTFSNMKSFSDTFSASFGAVSCLAFLHCSNFFITGYADGQVALWDLRNSKTGPVNTTSTLAGIRRWLVQLVPSTFDTVFSAFQTGAVMHLGSDILPVGGDARGAQCWGVAAWGSRIFAAMSSGVVLTVDTSLRDKLKRPMTSFTSQWEYHLNDEDDEHMNMVDESLSEKIIRLLSKNSSCGKITCQLYPPAKVPSNLKLMKPGVGNVPSESYGGLPLGVKAIAVSTTGIIAEGTDLGIIRISYI